MAPSDHLVKESVTGECEDVTIENADLEVRPREPRGSMGHDREVQATCRSRTMLWFTPSDRTHVEAF